MNVNSREFVEVRAEVLKQLHPRTQEDATKLGTDLEKKVNDYLIEKLESVGYSKDSPYFNDLLDTLYVNFVDKVLDVFAPWIEE